MPPANKRHTKAQASCADTDQSSYTGCWFTMPASGGASWALMQDAQVDEVALQLSLKRHDEFVQVQAAATRHPPP